MLRIRSVLPGVLVPFCRRGRCFRFEGRNSAPGRLLHGRETVALIDGHRVAGLGPKLGSRPEVDRVG